LRTDRAAKCFFGCFNDNPVDSLKLGTGPSQDHLLFAAAGQDVYIFDMRKDGILDRVPLSIASVIPDGEDSDINSIAIHPKGHLLAAASDDGGVHLVDLSSILPIPGAPRDSPVNTITNSSDTSIINTLQQPPQRISNATRRLENGHDNIASTVAFRPNPISSGDLLSGGFDCELLLWEHTNGKRKSHYHLGNSSNSPVGLNPPWIHSVAYACGGKKVLAGSGDGSLSIHEAGTLIEIGREEAHRGSFTSCIAVPTSAGTSTCASTSATEDDNTAAENLIGRIAFTGGNDGKLHAWKIKESLFVPKASKNKKKSKNKSRSTSTGAGAGADDEEDLLSGGLESLWTLDHGKKVNAVATWAGASVRGANVTVSSSSNQFTLFVGDTTKNVSVSQYMYYYSKL
jgi:WD40 repeat protein